MVLAYIGPGSGFLLSGWLPFLAALAVLALTTAFIVLSRASLRRPGVGLTIICTAVGWGLVTWAGIQLERAVGLGPIVMPLLAVGLVIAASAPSVQLSRRIRDLEQKLESRSQ